MRKVRSVALRILADMIEGCEEAPEALKYSSRLQRDQRGSAEGAPTAKLGSRGRRYHTRG